MHETYFNGEIELNATTFLAPVQERIRLVELKMRDVSNGHHPDLKAALDHLLSAGGKRIRPAVALLTGAMLGADAEKLITLAAAIELLHTATLVHDDLIDGALLRRGNPTLNSQWSPAATVLTGDFIFARAAKLAADTDSVEVMRLFAETLSTIVNGEITQLFPSNTNDYKSEYFKRIYAKTASMFVLATTAAAVLSPRHEEFLPSVWQYGHGIGMAFQIIDDILDFTGSQGIVGKPVANDLRQGLITLPTIYYMRIRPKDLDLEQVLKGTTFDEQRLGKITEAILDSGAIRMSLEDANEYICQALDALNGLPMTPERQALEDLANYIVNRHS